MKQTLKNASRKGNTLTGVLTPDKTPSYDAPKEYRNPMGKRFDLLVPEFIEDMARVMDVGAKKYGDNNWKTGLTGENSGLNHAMGHLLDYQAGRKSDHSDDPRFLLAQVAVNAMFEYFHAQPK